MFVCVCHAVTDSQIKQAVADGASNLTEVKLRLGLGNTCGKCMKMAGQIIKAEVNAKANYYEVA